MADSDTGTGTEDAKQCRICFEGEDPQLGRLIRPCLCKGSISVGSAVTQCVSSASHATPDIACARQVSSAVAEHRSQPERLLLVSTVRVQVSLRPHSSSGDRHEPRQVPSSLSYAEGSCSPQLS